MISVDDVLQNFVQGVPLRIYIIKTKTESLMKQRRTHMEVAIGVRWAIVQHKQWAFIVFPLLHEPRVSVESMQAGRCWATA